jgi:hypothetical protein
MNMKTMNTLLLAGAIALGLTVTANAGEALLSPRAKDNRTIVVPMTGSNPNLVTGTYLGAAGKWEATRAKVGIDSGKAGSLVGGNYAGAALKYPGRLDLKGETACTMACCS